MSNEKNKLDCEIVRDLLPLYYDGVVSETTKNAVKDHMGDCEGCLREYRDFCVETPDTKEENTGKRFGRMMNRQKIRQRIKMAVAAATACLMLLGTYFVLTEVPMVETKMTDIEIYAAFRYSGEDGEKMFIMAEDIDCENLVAYDRLSEENGRKSYEHKLKKPVISKKERTNDIYITTVDLGKNTDFDEFSYGGNVIWTKEQNSDDEIPAYVYGYDLFEYGSNNDEFGDSDAASWSCYFDRNTIKTGDGYFQLSHKTEGTIRWNLDGEVIYDSKAEIK